jgi:hypothetical protein
LRSSEVNADMSVALVTTGGHIPDANDFIL